MRGRFSILLLLSIVGACSANENANHGPRCDQGELCPTSEVCYRGFCIVDPQSIPNVDAATGPLIDSGAVALGEASSPVDTNGAGLVSGDGAVQAGPGLPVGPGLPMGPGLPVGPANDAALMTVPDVVTPITDAGAAISDASSVPPVAPASDAGPVVTPPVIDPMMQKAGETELLVCLASCAATRSPVCLACVGGVLTRYPTVCNAGARKKDATLNGLCAIACTTQLCRGEP